LHQVAKFLPGIYASIPGNPAATNNGFKLRQRSMYETKRNIRILTGNNVFDLNYKDKRILIAYPLVDGKIRLISNITRRKEMKKI
jgi:hypothetical protein